MKISSSMLHRSSDLEKNMIIKKSYFYLLILFLVTFIVYFPSLHNQILGVWDDQWQVCNVWTEYGLALANISDIVLNSLKGQYSPINQMMYSLIFSVDEYNPFLFHLYSLLLHSVNTCLVFLIIKRSCVFFPEINQENTLTVSFLSALLFAVHPLQVESVAWISASKVVLFSFFYLLGMLVFLMFLDSKKKRYYFYAILCFILSYGSKEQAVTFSFCLVILSWLKGENLKSRDVLMYLLPFFILTILFTMSFLLISRVDIFEIKYPIWQRPILASYVFIEYIIKWVFPANLSYMYLFPYLPKEQMPCYMVVYPILILVISFVSYSNIKKYRLWSFCVVFFIIHLFLVSNIIPTGRPTVIADRYMYLPSIPLCLLLSYYYVNLYRRAKHNSRYKNILLVVFIGYVLILALNSHNRIQVWKNDDTLANSLLFNKLK